MLYCWPDGCLKFYLTLRIDTVDDRFSMLIAWMTTDKPPFAAPVREATDRTRMG